LGLVYQKGVINIERCLVGAKVSMKRRHPALYDLLLYNYNVSDWSFSAQEMAAYLPRLSLNIEVPVNNWPSLLIRNSQMLI
jgi:hypothetical protein